MFVVHGIASWRDVGVGHKEFFFSAEWRGLTGILGSRSQTFLLRGNFEAEEGATQLLLSKAGLPPNQFRPQGPGHLARQAQALVPPKNLPTGSFVRGPSNYGAQGPYSQGPPPLSGAPRISQGEPLAGPPFGTPPPAAFESHGAPSHTPEGHLLQQHSANMVNYHADNRQLDPRSSGPRSTSTSSLHGERLKPGQDEHLNPFALDRAHRGGDNLSTLATQANSKFSSN